MQNEKKLKRFILNASELDFMFNVTVQYGPPDSREFHTLRNVIAMYKVNEGIMFKLRNPVFETSFINKFFYYKYLPVLYDVEFVPFGLSDECLKPFGYDIHYLGDEPYLHQLLNIGDYDV